ncbi:DUF2063 domain-containing protein [Marinomonas agarivorans]|nr:DUF2063 domain-containing protein [Marinomonas agarivorans]
MTSHQAYLDAFQRYMTEGDTTELLPYLASDSKQQHSEHFLAIYRNGFIKSAIGALESNFPTLAYLLSAEHFFYLARTYIERYPPACATLVGYGMPTTDQDNKHPSFLEYLAADVSMQEQPYLLDLGTLDQAWLQTLNAEKDEAITLEQVQTLIDAGEDLSLLSMSLITSSKMIALSFNVFELWTQVRFSETERSDKQKLVDNFVNGEFSKEAVEVLFWQQDNQVQAKLLNLAESHFLHSLLSTASLVKAEAAAVKVDEVFDLSLLFADLLHGQLLKLVSPYN